MKRILIIGANGFTGRQLLNDLASEQHYHLIGSSLREDLYSGQSPYPYDFYRANLRCPQEIEQLLTQTAPDVIINASALSVPDYCEQHRDEAYQTNVTAVEQMAQLSEERQIKLIHLSTDFVFNGSKTSLYSENDQPDPVNYYGFTKWKSEEQVAKLCEDHAIVRVAIVYGSPLTGQHGNIFHLTAEKLKRGEPIRVVSDQWRTPTFVGDISKGIEQLINHSQTGLFHLTGKDCLTISDIAFKVADYLKLDTSLIEPVTTQSLNEVTARPRFSGLNIDKARNAFGYTPLSIDEGLKKMFG